MKISTDQPTTGVNLVLSDIADKVFIEGKLWISTSYNVIKIGTIAGGKIYELTADGDLIETGVKVGLTGSKK